MNKFVDIAAVLRRHLVKSKDQLPDVLETLGDIVKGEGKIFVNENNIFTCKIIDDYCLVTIACGDWFDGMRETIVLYAVGEGVQKLRWWSARPGMTRRLNSVGSNAKVLGSLYEEAI